MTAMSPEMFRIALPHELSHSWWGGMVPNTYTVDMWNEGFASYSERLLNEASKPGPPRGLRAGEERASRWKLPPRSADRRRRGCAGPSAVPGRLPERRRGAAHVPAHRR